MSCGIFFCNLPRGQSAQHVPTAGSENVCGHAGQLHVAGLQQLLDAIRLVGSLLDQRLAIARQFAQLADLLGRDKAGAEQSQLQQLRDPLRVLEVGLPAGTLRMCWALANSTPMPRASNTLNTGFQ
jgi:hypothetical protein